MLHSAARSKLWLQLLGNEVERETVRPTCKIFSDRSADDGTNRKLVYASKILYILFSGGHCVSD